MTYRFKTQVEFTDYQQGVAFMQAWAEMYYQATGSRMFYTPLSEPEK